MKNIFPVLILSTFIISCSKDETAPLITMLGKSPDTLIVKTATSYNDPGATATDNEDGDVTDNIVVSTNINTNVVGSYRIYYNVEDKAGNISSEKTRIVEVIKATGTYAADYSCSITDNSILISSNFTNDTLTLSDIFISGTSIKAALSVTSYIIYQQTIVFGTEITGTITASGTTLSINFSTTGALPFANCTATLVRQ